MSRRAWIEFAAVQLVGAVCVWSGPRILSAPGPVLFLSGLVLLAPGGLLSLVIVEKLLWSSRLTLSGMTWVELNSVNSGTDGTFLISCAGRETRAGCATRLSEDLGWQRDSVSSPLPKSKRGSRTRCRNPLCLFQGCGG